MRWIIGIIMLTLIVSQVHAKTGFSTVNGAVLKKECTSALKSMQQDYPKSPQGILEASMDLGSCLSYVGGVNDAFYSMSGINSGVVDDKNAKISSPYCIPDNLEVEDLIKVILEYIDANPTALEVKGSIVIFGAFTKKFPCN